MLNFNFLKKLFTKQKPVMDQAAHVMIDLETLGNDYDGVITSIGACIFDPYGIRIGKTFYRRISIESSIEANRTFTGEAIRFWLKQSNEARSELIVNGEPFHEVLEAFKEFLPEAPIVWGNGSNFDIGKLETSYGYDNIPWKFWNIKDMRTLKWCYGTLKLPIIDVNSFGTKHHALDDAINQARTVMAIMRELKRATTNV